MFAAKSGSSGSVTPDVSEDTGCISKGAVEIPSTAEASNEGAAASPSTSHTSTETSRITEPNTDVATPGNSATVEEAETESSVDSDVNVASISMSECKSSGDSNNVVDSGVYVASMSMSEHNSSDDSNTIVFEDTADSVTKQYNTVLSKIQADHKRQTGQSLGLIVKSPVLIQCCVCIQNIKPGSVNKRFPALRTHITSRTHQMNVNFLTDEADPAAAVFDTLLKTYPQQFYRKGSYAVCRDDQCKIHMLPTKGDPLTRIRDHLDGSKHKSANSSSKLKASSLKSVASYFSKSQKGPE